MEGFVCDVNSILLLILHMNREMWWLIMYSLYVYKRLVCKYPSSKQPCCLPILIVSSMTPEMDTCAQMLRHCIVDKTAFIWVRNLYSQDFVTIERATKLFGMPFCATRRDKKVYLRKLYSRFLGLLCQSCKIDFSI